MAAADWPIDRDVQIVALRSSPKSESRNALLWWGSFYDRKHLTIGDAHATASQIRGTVGASSEG